MVTKIEYKTLFIIAITIYTVTLNNPTADSLFRFGLLHIES